MFCCSFDKYGRKLRKNYNSFLLFIINLSISYFRYSGMDNREDSIIIFLPDTPANYMWEHLKEFPGIDKKILSSIVKFWKTYKIFYIIVMMIVFILAFYISRFYKKEMPAFNATLNQIFQIRI